MRMWFLAIALSCATAAVAQPEQPCASPSTVTVSGYSSIRLRPDRVAFSVGVETTAPTVSQAFQQNNAKLNAVVAALKKRGVQSSELQTSNFTISSRDEMGERIRGYRVANLVTVTREGTSDVSELLQASVDAGATEAGSIRFFVADPKKSQVRGLELAFEDAKAKAERLASLSGKALGQVVSVSDQSMGYGPPPVPKIMSEAITVTAEAPAIESGVQDLSFGVHVVFELK